MCVVVAFSLLMHLSPFINHTDASGLKKGARGRNGTRHHLGKIPREKAVEYGRYPCVCNYFFTAAA